VNQSSGTTRSPLREGTNFVLGFWGVRYQVVDVSRSIEFYTQQLGFKLDHKHLPAFAQVSTANLKLILSGPGASGSRAMPDGRRQEPGGWNRLMLQVAELEDPDGNPIELFEPASE
jgi:glyoxylase I family protein